MLGDPATFNQLIGRCSAQLVEGSRGRDRRVSGGADRPCRTLFIQVIVVPNDNVRAADNLSNRDRCQITTRVDRQRRRLLIPPVMLAPVMSQARQTFLRRYAFSLLSCAQLPSSSPAVILTTVTPSFLRTVQGRHPL